jgi:hypothetical protein
MTTTTTRMPAPPRQRGQWLIPTGFILLSLIPILAGAARVTELIGSPVATPDNERFVAFPIPVLIHIVSATVFTLLGAFQFVPALRQRRGIWHRLAGRVLVPAGALAALSGMWMATFAEHAVGDGVALSLLRILFGGFMFASIALGVRAIVRKKFVEHGTWMTRAYAIGVGAGTQAIVLIPGSILFGSKDELSRAVLMGAAWVINLAIAELVIRRRAARRPNRAPAR